ncbi:MAG: hypothetical protein FWD53_12720, partial [Phycisphaerales bacterium]|nr:hypothetical protein [Phycisphaerales bacterium]
RDVQKAMALGELSRQNALNDRAALTRLLKSPEDVVRYYTAITILETKDSPDTTTALNLLQTMSDKHDLRQAAVQATMIVRIQKQKITAAIPWIIKIATDEKNDEGLRYTAVTALLTLRHPEAPRILADMIQKQTEIPQQVKLGLIALEGAIGGGGELKPAMLDPLTKSQVPLVKELAKLAQQAANGADITPGLLELLKQGHPIVLDWALANSETGDASRKLDIRKAIIQHATLIDNVRGREYERAARAAQRILEDNEDAGRRTIVTLLKSNNRAIVEAVLAGTYRSNAPLQAELVLPIWPTLTKTNETAANYAALILARENRPEPLTWLSNMTLGSTAQNTCFRALAGWYYAKLTGKAPTLLNKALAE